MRRIVVVGGGFAGLWSAIAASRVVAGANQQSRVEIVLVNPGPDLVIRPRLYEPDPGSKRVALDRVLGPLGVRRIEGTVTQITTEQNAVWVDVDGTGFSIEYSRLVLASGSQLYRPDVPGLEENAFSVDTLADALALERHLEKLPSQTSGPGQFRAAVIGAGFTGLEVATELAGALRRLSLDEAGVTLIEQSDAVGPDLGSGPRPVIEEALTQLRISYRLGAKPVAITPRAVSLNTGETIRAATTVWTAGLRASPLTSLLPVERDKLGRLPVDETLRVEGLENEYAAGDVAAAMADERHSVLMSCQHAIPLGKFAGHNAASSLLGHPTAPFAPPDYVTCLDLGQWGALFSEGWQRQVVMTGDEAKEMKRKINGDWIYPPRSGRRDEILEAADPLAARG